MTHFDARRVDTEPRRGMAHALLGVLLTIGLCLAAAELGAAIYFVTVEGRLPWLRGEHRAVPLQNLRNDPYSMQLNPYYGYMARPGIRLADVTARADILETAFGPAFMERDFPTIAMNNQGFLSKYDYPYADPKGRAFVIGLFGSSISIQLSLSMQDELTELLARDLHFAGRKVIMLNFAGAGTKQPQNASALAYFLSIGQKFDYIVNIDGFPELFIGWYNANVHATDERMPFARFIFGIQNLMLEAHGALAGDDRPARMLGRLNDLRRREADPQPALRALWLALEDRQLAEQLELLEKSLSRANTDESMTSKQTSRFGMPLLSRSTKNDAESLEAIVSTWFNGSLAMAGMAQSFGTPYLHVLQPNQYFTKAHFTDEQRGKLLDLTFPPVKDLVPKFYRRYLERAPEFAGYGVDFYDATRIFDEQDGSVFLDDCCHYTYAGNLILTRALAERILAGLGKTN